MNITNLTTSEQLSTTLSTFTMILSPISPLDKNTTKQLTGTGYTVLAYASMILLSCVMLCGIIGNSIVIYVFHRNHKKNRRWSTTDMLIVYLAYVDLLLSLASPSLYIYWEAVKRKNWHFGYAGCKILPTFSRFACNMAAALILIIAIDRCRVIVQPFKGHFTKREIRCACLLALVLSFLSCYHQVYHQVILESGLSFWKGCVIEDIADHAYALPELILLGIRDVVFLIVFTITTICIHRSLKSSQSSFQSSMNSAKSIARTRKTIRMLITLGVVFIILVVPRDLVYLTFIASWTDGSGIVPNITFAFFRQLLNVMQFSNSCINVFIYARMHTAFRRKDANYFSRVNSTRTQSFNPTQSMQRKRVHNKDTLLIDQDCNMSATAL